MDLASGAPIQRSTLKSIPALILSVAISLTVRAAAALRDVLMGLLCRFLIHLAAGPYPADELYDPSEDYELAREVLAMETLITGGLGSLIGSARVMRLLGAAEPIPGLVHCTAAVRTTPAGDDVYLAFELDPLLLDDCDGNSEEFSVQIIRTPSEDSWRTVERQRFADATAALLAFYSNIPTRKYLG